MVRPYFASIDGKYDAGPFGFHKAEYFELENEADNLRQREKQQLARQRDLEAEVAEAKQGHFVRDALIAALALACVALLLVRRRK